MNKELFLQMKAKLSWRIFMVKMIKKRINFLIGQGNKSRGKGKGKGKRNKHFSGPRRKEGNRSVPLSCPQRR